MRKVISIAISELRKLFYSPIAWLVVIVFVIQISYGFFERFDEMLSRLKSGDGTITAFAMRIFRVDYPTGVFFILKSNLYIYVPMITMGLLSREYANGTHKLLISSPIRNWQIVFGKFLTMIFYSLVLVLIVLVFALVLSFSITYMEWGYILSSLLGFFLLLITYSSIGIFISSLTTYQVVAAIATFAVIALLGVIGKVGQEVPILNDVLYWLSISDRADQMMNGLINSGSVAYFLIVSAFFIFITIQRLESGRRSESKAVLFTKYALALISTIGLAYLTSNPFLIRYADLTEGNRMTITPQSQEVLEKIQGKDVTFHTYVNVLSAMAKRSGLPKYYNHVYRQFEDYVRFVPQIKIKYTYFYDTIPTNPFIYESNPGLSQKELAMKMSKAYGLNFSKVLTPAEIRKRIDLSEEFNEYVMVIEIDGDTSFLRMYNDLFHYPKQEEISAAFNSALSGSPVVGFLVGHGERSFRSKTGKGYFSELNGRSNFRSSRANDGFLFREVDDLSSGSTADLSFLVVADPSTSLSSEELEQLSAFVDRGGNLLLLLENRNAKSFYPLLNKIGLKYLPGELKTMNSEYAPEIVFNEITDQVLQFSKNPLFKKFTGFVAPIIMSSAVAFAPKDTSGISFELSTILKTKPNTLLINNGDTTMGQHSTGFMLKRDLGSTSQRIMVIGDADFMANGLMERRIRNGNGLFFNQALFAWFAEDEFPVISYLAPGTSSSATISKSQYRIIKTGMYAGLPLLVFLLGAVILIIRKRK